MLIARSSPARIQAIIFGGSTPSCRAYCGGVRYFRCTSCAALTQAAIGCVPFHAGFALPCRAKKKAGREAHGLDAFPSQLSLPALFRDDFRRYMPLNPTAAALGDQPAEGFVSPCVSLQGAVRPTLTDHSYAAGSHGGLGVLTPLQTQLYARNGSRSRI